MRSKAKKAKSSKPDTRTTAAGIEARTAAGWVLVQRDGWPDAHWDIRAARGCDLGRDLPDLVGAAFDRLRKHLERGELIEVPQSNWSTPEGRKRLARRVGQPVKWRLETVLADLGNGENAYTWNAAKAPAVHLLVAFLQHAAMLAQMDCPATPRDAVFFELGVIAEAARLSAARGTAAAENVRKTRAAAGRTEQVAKDSLETAHKLEDTFRRIAGEKTNMVGYQKRLFAAADEMGISYSWARKLMDDHPQIRDRLKRLQL